MPTTVNDIANHVGLAASTVADVLRGRPGYAARTRQRIFDAAQELQFVPNYFAQSLMTRRSKAIGVAGSRRGIHIAGPLLAAIMDGLADRGYMPVLHAGARGPDEEVEIVQQLRARLVDGLILLNGGNDQMLRRIVSPGLPMVAIRYAPTDLCPSVVADRSQAIARGVHWLAEQGHRRIAFVGLDNNKATSPAHNTHSLKIVGYVEAMKALGLHAPDLLVDAPVGAGVARQFVVEHRDLFRSFTAVMACNDCVAVEVISGLAELGLRVPDDCSVMGFDDTPFAMAVTPRLTTYDPRHAEVGRSAVELLLEQIDGRDVTSQTVVPQLIERESVRPHRPESGGGD